ncbi:hypothetical protein LTR85_008997 [Meristemomyces frigidus]|nr:hypothetical protein LTR85_008997 [Meristemomyces frigidus]
MEVALILKSHGASDLDDALESDPRTRPRSKKQVPPGRVGEYRKYQKQLAIVKRKRSAAFKEFKSVVTTIYSVLPTEILGNIIRWYAKVNAPVKQPWSELQTVGHQAAQMVLYFDRIAARCCAWEGESKKLYGYNGVRVEDAVNLVDKQARAAIFKNTVWQWEYHHSFGLPITSVLGAWNRFICNLDLHIHVPVRVDSTIYPTDLYVLQDNIKELKSRLPCLTSVVVEVTVPQEHDGTLRSGMLRRGVEGTRTSMAVEQEKLVRKMRNLAVRERYVWYHEMTPVQDVKEEEDGRHAPAALVAETLMEGQSVIRI